MLTKEQLVLTKSPEDFFCYFPWLYLVKYQQLLINLHGLSWLDLNLFLCESKNVIFFRFSARSCGLHLEQIV